MARANGNGLTTADRIIAMRATVIRCRFDSSGLYVSRDQRLGFGCNQLTIIGLGYEIRQPIANEGVQV